MDERGYIHELNGVDEEARKKEIKKLMEQLGCTVEEVNSLHMTPFQEKNKRVSSHDNRSKLAKQLKSMRKRNSGHR